MFFDTHAHYEDRRFSDDREELLRSMPENGVSLIVNAGSDMRTSAASLDLAERFPFIYAAVGVHPHEAKGMAAGDMDALRGMLTHEKAVALGEIGLDYHYDFSPRHVQKAAFKRQLELALEADMPVVIHEREALCDTMGIAEEFAGRGLSAVFHCFSGDWEAAQTVFSKGWFISLGGAVTFKNAHAALEVLKKMPRDRLMLETDCPYMSPVPNRGRRNDSRNLKYVAEKVAEIWGVTAERVAELTMENGKRFFRL
jgi:TatD DNase family protein